MDLDRFVYLRVSCTHTDLFFFLSDDSHGSVRTSPTKGLEVSVLYLIALRPLVLGSVDAFLRSHHVLLFSFNSLSSGISTTLFWLCLEIKETFLQPHIQMWRPGRARLPVHCFTVNLDCICCQLHLDWNIIETTNNTLTKKITPFYIKLFINFTIDRTQNLHHWGQLHPPWRSTGKGDHWDQPRSGCPGPVVWLGWDGLEKPDPFSSSMPWKKSFSRCPVDPLWWPWQHQEHQACVRRTFMISTDSSRRFKLFSLPSPSDASKDMPIKRRWTRLDSLWKVWWLPSFCLYVVVLYSIHR